MSIGANPDTRHPMPRASHECDPISPIPGVEPAPGEGRRRVIRNERIATPPGRVRNAVQMADTPRRGDTWKKVGMLTPINPGGFETGTMESLTGLCGSHGRHPQAQR